MPGRPTQFASKTGVGTTGLFLCSNGFVGDYVSHLDDFVKRLVKPVVEVPEKKEDVVVSEARVELV